MFSFCIVVFVQLSFRSQKLLETRRSKDAYEAEKRRYDQACEQYRVVLDSWSGEEYMIIQRSRQAFEGVSSRMSKNAHACIDRATKCALQEMDLGNMSGYGDPKCGKDAVCVLGASRLDQKY